MTNVPTTQDFDFDNDDHVYALYQLAHRSQYDLVCVMPDIDMITVVNDVTADLIEPAMQFVIDQCIESGNRVVFKHMAAPIRRFVPEVSDVDAR